MLKPVSRSFQDGDETQIVNLYNKITGRNRTVSQHQWEWLKPPEGQGSMWVIEDKATNEIVGHHGLIPIRIIYNGQSLRMGKTENTIIHPNLLGNGIYFLYEKKFFAESSKKFDILATTSGHGAPGKIRKRLQYKPVSNYEIYFTLCSRKNICKALKNILTSQRRLRFVRSPISYIAGVLSFFCSPIFRSKKNQVDNIKLSYILSINDYKDMIDQFWGENADQFGITIERSSDFLKWRIFENPNIEYTFLAAEQEKKLVGYAILKKSKGQFNYGVIEDIVAKNCNQAIYLALLCEVKNFFNLEQCAAIIFPTLKSNRVLETAFKNAGYKSSNLIFKLSKLFLKRKIPDNAEFLVNKIKCDLNETDLLDPSKWYFTGLFFEGIN